MYYLLFDVFKHNKLTGFGYIPFKLKIICISNLHIQFCQHWECSWVEFVNVIYNQMKYLFLKRKGGGTNINLYIVKICVYIYFSFLTLLDHYIRCIFVHNIYWLEKFRLSIERNSISVIEYIYPNLLIFCWFVLRDRTLFFKLPENCIHGFHL